jgi:hypothetical protein
MRYANLFMSVLDARNNRKKTDEEIEEIVKKK